MDEDAYIYRAIGKAQFAEDAGVSPSTLRKWIRKEWGTIEQFGQKRFDKVLLPATVAFLSSKYVVCPRNATKKL